MSEKRVLRVKGQGMLRLKPDQIRIVFTMTGCFTEYEETMRHSVEET